MAFLKYAKATLQKPGISFAEWDALRSNALSPAPDFQKRTARIILQEYDPSKYMLSHATIVASVDVDNASAPLGRHFIDGFEVDRQYLDYYITPETARYINNNNDAFERKLLLASFKTFIGAQSFVEHVQIPELSKGRIIDAAARDVGESVYIDILIANDLRHAPLIRAIKSGQLGTLSMGCSTSSTICTKCGNVALDETQLCSCVRFFKGNEFVDDLKVRRKIAELCFPPGTRVWTGKGSIPIEEIGIGECVLTHKGRSRSVYKTFKHLYEGDLTTLKVVGLPFTTFRSTPKHPYYVLSAKDECICGCGHRFKHRSYSQQEYTRTYAPGHNPTNIVGSTKLPDFTFKEASKIKVGDILALPVPTEVRISSNVNEEKALLLGWFLAEGSYVKYKGVLAGVDFTLNAEDEGEVADKIAALLTTNFNPECDLHKEFVPKVWGALVRPATIAALAVHMNCSRNTIKLVLRKHPTHFKPVGGRGVRNNPVIWGRCGEEPVFDKHPCIYHYPRTEGGFKLVVRYRNKKAASWFFRHANEYASSKRLSEEALFWPVPLQSKVLQGYVRGDGSVDCIGRHHVSTVSSVLASQTRLLAARCGFWTRQQIVYEGKTVQLNVVNGEPFAGSDGFLPRFDTYFHRSTEVEDFFQMSAVQLHNKAPKWRKLGNYLLHRVKEVGSEFYQGPVYNLSVEEDESYLIEGIAVHNCGHYTDQNSVRFIEASWVANPAFKGAVLRNILSPDELRGIEKKMHMAFSLPTPAVDPNLMAKAARQTWGQGQEQFSPDDQMESPAEGGEDKEDPFQKAVDDVAEAIRSRAVKKVRDELSEQEVSELRDLNPNKQNESLIRSAVRHPEWKKIARLVISFVGKANARRVLYGLLLHKNGGWPLIRTAGFTGKELLAISRVLDLMTKKSSRAGETRVYRTVLSVGGTGPYADVETYLEACRQVFGRVVTGSEAAQLLEKGRLFNLGRP